MNTVAIIGTGALGSALIKRFKGDRIIVKYFDNDLTKPRTENSIEEIIKGAEVIFLCIPTRALKETVDKILNLKSTAIVVSLSKGIASDGKTAAEILSETLNGKIQWAVVGGPMIAEEIRNDTGLVTAAIGSQSDETAKIIEKVFKESDINSVSNFDPFAVSLLGILKNIYAFGMGILSGLGASKDKKDSFVKMALSEMKNFCRSEKFDASIVDSPAGKDDLLETGGSDHSRNRAMGFELATIGKIKTTGESLEAAPQFTNRFQKAAKEMPTLTFLTETMEGKRPAKEIIDIIK